MYQKDDLIIHGKYRVEKLLGEGSFGSVYRVRDLIMDDIVAIKRLHNPDNRSAYEKEIKVLAKLRKAPHVLTFSHYEFDESGAMVLVMGYMAGGSLEQVLIKDGALPEADAYILLQHMVEALVFSHGLKKPILHKDIKPANILREGADWYLGDWGIGGSKDGSSTKGAGTFFYNAPEVFEGKRYPESDIYSLGMTIFHVLTGQPGFTGSDAMVMMGHLQKTVDFNKNGIPSSLQPLLQSMLEKDPKKRPSAAELIRRIKSSPSTKTTGSWLSSDQDPMNGNSGTLLGLDVVEVATVNKDLTTIKRQKFMEFLAQNKKVAEFFVNVISRYGNVLDIDFIEQHADQLNWDELSRNKSVPWSEALIDRYKYRWNWGPFNSNESLPLSEALIERFEDKWYWPGLSANKSIPWSEALIDRFVDKWNWGYGLSENNYLPWSEALIERYADKWNWKVLSCNKYLPWSEALIERYKDKWDWGWLSANESLPWSESLLERYADKLVVSRLSANESLPWSEALIDRYVDKWNWGNLSNNKSLTCSEALIDRYADKWDWGFLSNSKSLPCSEALIDRYVDKWDWRCLSNQRAAPCNEALIERYVDKWDWNNLSWNESLPWSEALIERYADKWDWNNLSWNKSLPWSEALIERYVDKWGWNQLSFNESLPWSEALIELYADKWDWSELNDPEGFPNSWDWDGLYYANKKIIFNNWTKQEISTALEMIRSAQKNS